MFGAAPNGATTSSRLTIQNNDPIDIYDPQRGTVDAIGAQVYWYQNESPYGSQTLSLGLQAEGSAPDAVTSLDLGAQNPKLSKFTSQHYVTYEQRDEGSRGFLVNGNITSFERQAIAVPEPSGTVAMGLGAVGALAVAVRFRRRPVAV